MTLAIPLVMLLGLIVWLLHRDDGLRVWQSVIIGLFGFYLADSGVGGLINGAVSHLLRGLSHI